MSEPRWVLGEVVLAVHSLLLAEHGGGSGIRDKGMLDSALARPRQKYNYEPETTAFQLAAAYSFAISKNHPFVDGNKRTAFTIGALFLELNGLLLKAPEPDAALMFEGLAAGKVQESDLAQWFKENSVKA